MNKVQKMLTKAMRVGRKPGFTMMELMMVLGVLIMLIVVFRKPLMNLFTGGAQAATQARIQNVKQLVQQFQLKMGRFPKSIGELTRRGAKASGWTGPYLDDEDLTDKYRGGNPLFYNRPPKRKKEQYQYYEIYSLGADGEMSPDDDFDGE